MNPLSSSGHPGAATPAGRHLPLWLYVVLVVALPLLLAAATWLAWRQPPHPDMFRPVSPWDIAKPDWWLYPLERNAFRRLMVRGSLHALFNLPGTKRLWAVGSGGLILHSPDGGRTWQQQRPTQPQKTEATQSLGRQEYSPKLSLWPQAYAAEVQKSQELPRDTNQIQQANKKDPPADTRDQPQVKRGPLPEDSDLNAVYFTDTRHGWAVGRNGTILATADGGKTWTPQASGSDADLNSVTFLPDGQSGWAVGRSGTILATANGGKTWTPQANSSEADLYSVTFLPDGQSGWAVGSNGTILATVDGAKTWTLQVNSATEDLNSVTFLPNGKRGWAVGNKGTILANADGANTWTLQVNRTTKDLNSVTFLPDGQHGWAVGWTGTILSTIDGGKIWTTQASGTTEIEILNAVIFLPDGKRGWAAGWTGAILSTADGGKIWTTQVRGLDADLNSVTFLPDEKRGWAVGNKGTILTTVDGGKTWTPEVRSTTQVLLSVTFPPDGQHGWAVGAASTILATADSGKTWTSQETNGTAGRLNSVTFQPDGWHGWAVDLFGIILATADGGKTWTSQETSGAGLNSVTFLADGQSGWAVGNKGTILATTNGGKTWTPQANSSEADLASVAFLPDGQSGWAVGNKGTILATTNGGKTWIPQANSSEADLASVAFLSDGQSGWAVGNKGTILATTNGGKTWAPQFSGTNADLASVTFLPDSRHGWVVGTSGTILATGDDNTRWESIAPYRRYWAPWYFALLLVGGSALAGLIAFVHPVSANAPSSDGPSGTATTLACDQPVLDKAADLLGYRAVVEALSSFIRNRATEPRVTIAVTGEWGSGKSSIMRMLQTDLDRAGFRTVWFNAWHHQQEGRPLAALFNSIRQQAVSLGALHTRSRLIWGRGGLYRVVACVAAIGLAVLAGDLLGEGLENAGQRVQQNIKYHVLHERSSYLGLASLAKLAPPAADIQADNSPADQTGTAGDQAARSGSQDLGRIRKDCAPEGALTKAKGGPLPGQVFCDLALNLVPDSEWLGSVQPSTCNARADADGKPCVFASLAGLLRTIEDSKGLDRPLTNPQRKLIGEAVQTQPPEPMFRWLQSSLLSGAAGVMLLLFTKGISVYGLQLLGPLQDVLGRLANKSNGKEAPGTVEHYRHEFRLLCQALDGRLVVFIDDLDRCTPDTVNGMLELTNYLVDVGSCFVVLGAAMERVKKCIHSPVETDDQERYACEYLRKLVHVELPVPLRRDELGRLINPHADRQRRSTRRTLWRQIRSCLKALMVIAFLVGFVHAGMALHNRIDGQAQVVDRVIAPTGEGRPPVQPDPGKDPGTEPTMADSKDVGLDAPINTEGSWPWLALSGLTLLLGSALVWRILWHYRDALKVALGGSIRETDSPNFLEALRLWSPLIAQHDPTPRQLKRFYNRARLLAAYERESSTSKPKAETMGESQPASPFKRLLHILKRLLTGFSGELPASASQSEAMDEAQLVALSALHHVYPPALEILANTATDLAETWDSIAKVLPNQSLAPAFSQARKDHQQKFSSLPCADEARRFAQLVAGIEVR